MIFVDPFPPMFFDISIFVPMSANRSHFGDAVATGRTHLRSARTIGICPWRLISGTGVPARASIIRIQKDDGQGHPFHLENTTPRSEECRTNPFSHHTFLPNEPKFSPRVFAERTHFRTSHFCQTNPISRGISGKIAGFADRNRLFSTGWRWADRRDSISLELRRGDYLGRRGHG
jgi:hypothetical protein